MQLNVIPTAGASTAGGSGGPKIAKKVELVPDPGIFSGSYAKFNDWWCRIKMYLAANKEAFSNNESKAICIFSHIGSKENKDKNGAGAWACLYLSKFLQDDSLNYPNMGKIKEVQRLNSILVCMLTQQ